MKILRIKFLQLFLINATHRSRRSAVAPRTYEVAGNTFLVCKFCSVVVPRSGV